MEVRTTGCCGVLELVDISTFPLPEAMITYGMESGLPCRGSRLRPFIFFTGVTARKVGDHVSSREDNYGLALADYIKQEGLGEVVDGIPERPNWTGNMLKMWVWIPDYVKLWDWWEAQIPATTAPAIPIDNPHIYISVDGVRTMDGQW